MVNLSDEQLGRLICKADHEPRRNAKRYLKDLGGDGSADELDQVLETARANSRAVEIADRLSRQRELTAKAVDAGVDGRVAEMLADVRLRMQDRGMTQAELAEACGMPQSLVGAYLTGSKSPGIENLAKLAEALGAVWRLNDA
jgi:ribosome-binding protein aMBF1 (putative translation factor)